MVDIDKNNSRNGSNATTWSNDSFTGQSSRTVGSFTPKIPSSSFNEIAEDDSAAFHSAMGTDNKIDFGTRDLTASTNFPSMVDRIPPALAAVDQRLLQQQITHQEEITNQAGQALSNCMFYQFKFTFVGAGTGTYYSLRVLKQPGNIMPIAWGTVAGSILDFAWGYNVDCKDKNRIFEDEKEKLRLLRMRTVSYDIRKY